MIGRDVFFLFGRFFFCLYIRIRGATSSVAPLHLFCSRAQPKKSQQGYNLVPQHAFHFVRSMSKILS
jgi:hypothetical protein